MDPELTDVSVLEAFLKEKKLEKVEKIAKGFSSQIYLVKDEKGRKLALKMERKDSPRKMMVEKEAEHLQAANKAGIGPKLVWADVQKRIILYEFVEGRTFNRWMNQQPSRQDLLKVLKELFRQANKLDEIGLSLALFTLCAGPLRGRRPNHTYTILLVTSVTTINTQAEAEGTDLHRGRLGGRLVGARFPTGEDGEHHGGDAGHASGCPETVRGVAPDHHGVPVGVRRVSLELVVARGRLEPGDDGRTGQRHGEPHGGDRVGHVDPLGKVHDLHHRDPGATDGRGDQRGRCGAPVSDAGARIRALRLAPERSFAPAGRVADQPAAVGPSRG